ncbi:mutS protein homolog 4-like [Paramacrobiotus metropolitanus]|uniref:mutS protein homolog 4-like n=1 Tax=Paramacrobiotus metropolitanus TaxID=2943436 RepID=UPI002445E688|nr:mutS protein homolog 4-like [Paramacrobiotus metropolitanus]
MNGERMDSLSPFDRRRSTIHPFPTPLSLAAFDDPPPSPASRPATVMSAVIANQLRRPASSALPPSGRSTADSFSSPYFPADYYRSSRRSLLADPIFSQSTEPAASASVARSAKTIQPGDSASCSGYPASVRVTNSKTSEESGRGQPGVIVALAEGRGVAHGEIGLATIDMRTSVVELGQYADTASYMRTIIKLNVLEPSVVVISETMTSADHPSPLYIILRELHFHGGPNVITVQRKHFNEGFGMDKVKKLNLLDESKLETELASKYYCLASFAALVCYVEYEYKIVLVHKSLRMKYMHMEDTCLIDSSTARSLEVLANAQDPHQKKDCLFGILDHTKTYAGGRLLRTNLLQPFTKLETINMRLECIEELIMSEEMFFGLQQLLGRFIDVERVIWFLIQIPKKDSVRESERHIGSFIHLKHVLGLVEPLRECIKESTNALFRGFYELLSDSRYEEMRNVIDVLVHPEAKYEKGTLRMKTQKCYALKSHINGCLDVARLLYSESVDDVSAHVNALAERHGLPLQIGYEAGRGFCIQLHSGPKNPVDVTTLPPEFLYITKKRNMITFTTKDLIFLNGKILQCVRDIFVLSDEMLKHAHDSLRPFIGCLYELTECVATIDVIVSLTHACSLGEYVRPRFHGALVLEQSRHPVLDRLLAQQPVPNNAFVDESNNFLVITGANMAGKTTYIKQVALLQIMAQIGSFVPATFASFPVFEQIFSRFGSGDDIASNASTFMVEMRDMFHICTQANEKTLVLIDELGRGTSPEEGVAVCWALCEQLLLTKATTLFVTHYEEICDLQHLYPNVHNVNFKTIIAQNPTTSTRQLVYTHEMVDGPCMDISYGIALAEATSLPTSLTRNAMEMLEKIRRIKFTMGEDEKEFRQRQIDCRYANRVIQLVHNKSLPYDDIVACLMQIKADYQTEMAILAHQELAISSSDRAVDDLSTGNTDSIPHKEGLDAFPISPEMDRASEPERPPSRSEYFRPESPAPDPKSPEENCRPPILSPLL